MSEVEEDEMSEIFKQVQKICKKRKLPGHVEYFKTVENHYQNGNLSYAHLRPIKYSYFAVKKTKLMRSMIKSHKHMNFQKIDYWQRELVLNCKIRASLLLEQFKTWLMQGYLIKLSHMKKLFAIVPHWVVACCLCNVLEVMRDNFEFFQRKHTDFHLVKTFKELYMYLIQIRKDYGQLIKEVGLEKFTTYEKELFKGKRKTLVFRDIDRKMIDNFKVEYCCFYCGNSRAAEIWAEVEGDE